MNPKIYIITSQTKLLSQFIQPFFIQVTQYYRGSEIEFYHRTTKPLSISRNEPSISVGVWHVKPKTN